MFLRWALVMVSWMDFPGRPLLETSPWLWVAAGLLVLGLLRAALQRWGALTRQRRHRLRAKRAAAAERTAERLLVESGYQLLDSQPRQKWTVFVNRAPLEVALKADLLVAKGARRYVAEVKSGALAPQIRNPATRRQLLEYRLAYDVDGVLLVDMENGEISEIDFPPAGNRSKSSGIYRWIALGMALGAGLTHLLKHLLRLLG